MERTSSCVLQREHAGSDMACLDSSGALRADSTALRSTSAPAVVVAASAAAAVMATAADDTRASSHAYLSSLAAAAASSSSNLSSGVPPATPRVRRALPLTSLNHVSIHCRDVKESLRFYVDLMGFIPVRRPACLDYFDGAWLFNYGIGIHLLKDEECNPKPKDHVSAADINPRADHVSFQCEDIEAVEALLQERGVPFVRQTVEEHGVEVQQLFFLDPDGHMIEICNCDALPVVPLQGSPSTVLQPVRARDPTAPMASAVVGCSRRSSRLSGGAPSPAPAPPVAAAGGAGAPGAPGQAQGEAVPAATPAAVQRQAQAQEEESSGSVEGARGDGIALQVELEGRVAEVAHAALDQVGTGGNSQQRSQGQGGGWLVGTGGQADGGVLVGSYDDGAGSVDSPMRCTQHVPLHPGTAGSPMVCVPSRSVGMEPSGLPGFGTAAQTSAKHSAATPPPSAGSGVNAPSPGSTRRASAGAVMERDSFMGQQRTLHVTAGA